MGLVGDPEASASSVRLISIAGTSGQGKTWLLDALRAKLTAEDPYWQSLGNGESGSAGEDLTTPVLPNLMWATHSANHSHAVDLLADLRGQISVHEAVLRQAARERRSVGEKWRDRGVGVGRIALSAVGGQVLGPAVLGGELLEEGLKSLRNRRAQDATYRAALSQDPRPRAEDCARLLHEVCGPGMPLLISIDDAQAVDGERLFVLLDALLAPSGAATTPVTVVYTIAAGVPDPLEVPARNRGIPTSSLVLPDMAVAEGAHVARWRRPELTEDEARQVGERLRIPKAMAAALDNAADTETLMATVTASTPHSSASIIYQDLWHGLPSEAQEALLGYFALLAASAQDAMPPRQLAHQLWRELFQGQPAKPRFAHLLREDKLTSTICLGDPGLVSILNDKYREAGRTVRERLDAAVLGVLRPFALSVSPWVGADLATINFVSLAVQRLVRDGRLQPGDGAVIAADLAALIAPLPEDAQRHLNLAEEWLRAQGPAGPEVQVLHAFTSAFVSMNMAAAAGDPVGIAAAFHTGVEELRRFTEYNDQHWLRLHFAKVLLEAGDCLACLREAKRAVKAARYMGSAARTYEARCRMFIIEALAESDALDDACAEWLDLRTDMIDWFPAEHPLRRAVEGTLFGRDCCGADSTSTPSANVESRRVAEEDLRRSETRLERLQERLADPTHAAVLRAHLEVAERCLSLGELAQARHHSEQASALLEHGGPDAARFIEIRKSIP